MVAPVLATYEYQFKDSGLKLNSDSTGLPFVDVTGIQGLDMPAIDAKIGNFDGRHGGTVTSKYVSARTIVIDGIIYANPDTVDTYVDDLTDNFTPDDVYSPFYFKGAGVAQRYVMCKSLGMKCDLSTLRRIGSATAQFQLFAGDPIKYVDNANVTLTHNVNSNVTNSGKVPTDVIYTITGNYATVTLTALGKNVVLTKTGGTVSDITVVNFGDKSVKLNGNFASSMITTAQWWSLPPNTTTAVKYSATSPNPNPLSVVISTKSGWL